jgi:hypothetical protein
MPAVVLPVSPRHRTIAVRDRPRRSPSRRTRRCGSVLAFPRTPAPALAVQLVGEPTRAGWSEPPTAPETILRRRRRSFSAKRSPEHQSSGHPRRISVSNDSVADVAWRVASYSVKRSALGRSALSLSACPSGRGSPAWRRAATIQVTGCVAVASRPGPLVAPPCRLRAQTRVGTERPAHACRSRPGWKQPVCSAESRIVTAGGPNRSCGQRWSGLVIGCWLRADDACLWKAVDGLITLCSQRGDLLPERLPPVDGQSSQLARHFKVTRLGRRDGSGDG